MSFWEIGTVMTKLLLLLTVAFGRVTLHRGRDDRGDVPGWVLITVMTAGLVAALWAIAGPQLSQLLRDALSSVRS